MVIIRTFTGQTDIMSKVNFETLFPDKRNEYTEPLKQIQAVQLRILKIVDYICQKNDIQYWLDSGTLLGAVRHKGFIPWDDDIDIVMTRENYTKFKKVQNQLPNDLFYQSRDSDPKYKYTWDKVRDRKSTGLEFFETAKPEKYHLGLYIDIFIHDYTNHPQVYTAFKRFLFCRYDNKWIKVLMKLFRHPLVGLIGKTNIIKIVNRLVRNNLNTCQYLVQSVDDHFIEYFDKKSVFPLKKMQFEDAEFPVPHDCHSYLTKMYGDYMKLPPEEDRHGHLDSVDVNRRCKRDYELNY